MPRTSLLAPRWSIEILFFICLSRPHIALLCLTHTRCISPLHKVGFLQLSWCHLINFSVELFRIDLCCFHVLVEDLIFDAAIKFVAAIMFAYAIGGALLLVFFQLIRIFIILRRLLQAFIGALAEYLDYPIRIELSIILFLIGFKSLHEIVLEAFCVSASSIKHCVHLILVLPTSNAQAFTISNAGGITLFILLWLSSTHRHFIGIIFLWL